MVYGSKRDIVLKKNVIERLVLLLLFVALILLVKVKKKLPTIEDMCILCFVLLFNVFTAPTDALLS